MTFSDSDWTRDPPRRRARTSQRLWLPALLIALFCIAVAMVWFGIEQSIEAPSRSEVLRRQGSNDGTAVAPALPTPAPVAGDAPPAAAPSATPSMSPIAAVATASAPAAPDGAAERRQLDVLEAEMRQRAQETAQQASADAARRKERAWARWYQRPAFCSDNPTSAQLVQCANEYMRARKEFEERYPAPRLQP